MFENISYEMSQIWFFYKTYLSKTPSQPMNLKSVIQETLNIFMFADCNTKTMETFWCFCDAFFVAFLASLAYGRQKLFWHEPIATLIFCSLFFGQNFQTIFQFVFSNFEYLWRHHGCLCHHRQCLWHLQS